MVLKKPTRKKITTGSRKKTAPKKKTAARKPAKKKTASSGFGNKISTWLMTAGIILVFAAVAYVLLHPKPPEPKPTAVKPELAHKAPRFDKPRFEIFTEKPIPPPKKAPVKPKPAVAPTPEQRPQVAIIIDDIGYNKPLTEKFMNLNAPLTYALLPYSRYQEEIRKEAEKKGRQLMLHLPMEPNEYPDVDPGPGVLLTSMTPDERIDQLKKNLETMPFVKGVNNHMGSKMTTLSDQMNQVFSILKKQGLFFIDSRTTEATQCRLSAARFNLPFAERDVFLDNIQTEEAIRKQIEELINIATIHGKAVGIGHPYEITYRTLAKVLPEIKTQVDLVSASEIVEVPSMN